MDTITVVVCFQIVSLHSEDDEKSSKNQLWFAFKLYLCTAIKKKIWLGIELWFAFKLYLCTAFFKALLMPATLWFAFKLYLCTASVLEVLEVSQLWFAFKLYLCTASVEFNKIKMSCGLLSNCIFAQLSALPPTMSISCGLLSNCIFAQPVS